MRVALAVFTVEHAAVLTIKSAVDAESATAIVALVQLVTACCAKLSSTVANIAALYAQVVIASCACIVGLVLLTQDAGLKALVL